MNSHLRPPLVSRAHDMLALSRLPLIRDLLVVTGSYSWPRWATVFGACLALDAIAILCSLATPLLTGAALDVLVAGSVSAISARYGQLLSFSAASAPVAAVAVLCALAGFLTICSVVCATYSARLLAQRTREFQSHIRAVTLHRLMSLRTESYDSLSTGVGVTLVRSDAAAAGELIRSAVYAPVKNAVQLVGTSIAVGTINPWLPIVSLGLAPLVWLTHRSWNASVLPLHTQAARVSALCDTTVSTMLRGLRVMRIYNGEAAEADRWRSPEMESIAIDNRIWWEINFVRALWDLLLPTLSLAVLWVCRSSLLAKTMSAGDVLVFTVCIGMLATPMHALAQSIASVQNASAAMVRLRELINRPLEPVAYDQSAISLRRSLTTPPSIGLLSASYQYASARDAALKDVSLTIEAGQVVAVVGRNGSGKSTLLNLIGGFFCPTGGCIEVDGTDIRQWSLCDYRRYIALVEQDVYLFPGSVADNIRYSRPTATVAEVDAAIRLIAVGGFLESLPCGKDSIIGEGGSGVSGGQRQRISLARAMLKHPDIMLLDEWSSHLDPSAEGEILENMLKAKSGATIVMVTHRMSVAARADVVVFLDRGRLIASGSHENLLSTCPGYADLWRSLPQPSAMSGHGDALCRTY